MGCTSLNKIVFHDNVKKIESQAFYNCESLISVVIGNGITEIGTQAFNICTSLTNVTLGTSLNSIGWSAFAGCYKLVDVYNLSSLNITKGSSDNGHVAYYALNVYTSIEEQGKFTTTDDGYVFYEDGENIWLVGYNGIETELTLPDKFNGKNYAINQRALYNKSFTSIIIPDCVISIGDYAFSECGVLTSVIIGNGVTSIGDNAFASCYSLTTVIIGNNVTILGNYVFSDCNSLTSITIPEGVTVIGDYAFAQCSSLTKIIIPNGVMSVYIQNKACGSQRDKEKLLRTRREQSLTESKRAEQGKRSLFGSRTV